MKLNSLDEAIKDYEAITGEDFEWNSDYENLIVLPDNSFMTWRIGEYDGYRYFEIRQTYGFVKNLNFLYKLDDSVAHRGSNLWISFNWSNQDTTYTNDTDTYTVYRVVKYTKDSGRPDDRQKMAVGWFLSTSLKNSTGSGGHYSGSMSMNPISSDIPSSQIAGVYAYIQVTNPTNFSISNFHLHSGSSETAYSGVTNLVNKNQITTTISVDGTAQTEPELSIIPNADQYYLGYTLNDDGYMGIGADESQTIDAADGTTVVPAREVITSDGCGSLASWTTDQNVVNSYRDWETDRKSTRLNSSHSGESRMPSSA